MNNSRNKEESSVGGEIPMEGITWPSNWNIYTGDDGTIYYGECPICKEKFRDRISAREHNHLYHRPEIILDDGCCSCWKHC